MLISASLFLSALLRQAKPPLLCFLQTILMLRLSQLIPDRCSGSSILAQRSLRRRNGNASNIILLTSCCLIKTLTLVNLANREGKLLMKFFEGVNNRLLSVDQDYTCNHWLMDFLIARGKTMNFAAGSMNGSARKGRWHFSLN